MDCSFHLIFNFILNTFLWLNINSAAEIEGRLIEHLFEIDTTALVYDSKDIENELHILNLNVETSIQERQSTR
jgi:hypothetical protein